MRVVRGRRLSLFFHRLGVWWGGSSAFCSLTNVPSPLRASFAVAVATVRESQRGADVLFVCLAEDLRCKSKCGCCKARACFRKLRRSVGMERSFFGSPPGPSAASKDREGCCPMRYAPCQRHECGCLNAPTCPPSPARSCVVVRAHLSHAHVTRDMPCAAFSYTLADDGEPPTRQPDWRRVASTTRCMAASELHRRRHSRVATRDINTSSSRVPNDGIMITYIW